MKQRKAALLLLLSLVVGVLVLAFTFAAPGIERWVIGGGGGPASSASYKLNGTAGQAVVGFFSSSSYRLGAGFWYGLGTAIPPAPTATSTPTRTRTPTATPSVPAPFHLYLPLIMKDVWLP